MAGLLALSLNSTYAEGGLTFLLIILLLSAWESGKEQGAILDLRFRPSLSRLYVVAGDVCRLQKLSETLSGIERLRKKWTLNREAKSTACGAGGNERQTHSDHSPSAENGFGPPRNLIFLRRHNYIYNYIYLEKFAHEPFLKKWCPVRELFYQNLQHIDFYEQKITKSCFLVTVLHIRSTCVFDWQNLRLKNCAYV